MEVRGLFHTYTYNIIAYLTSTCSCTKNSSMIWTYSIHTLWLCRSLHDVVRCASSKDILLAFCRFFDTNICVLYCKGSLCTWWKLVLPWLPSKHAPSKLIPSPLPLSPPPLYHPLPSPPLLPVLLPPLTPVLPIPPPLLRPLVLLRRRRPPPPP